MSIRFTVLAGALALAALQPAAAATPQTGATTPAIAQTATDGAFRIAQARQYFVVIGSFRQYGAAQRRCSQYDGAYVINTGEYPNFRPGYFSCVIGPLYRSQANAELRAVRRYVPDAYVKSGW